MKENPVSLGYSPEHPDRESLDSMEGKTVVQFGTDFCGYSIAAERFIAPAMADNPDVKHIKVEDGKGRRLGRTYGVKLWPTMIFLKDGTEVARVVRPTNRSQVDEALAKLDA